MGHDVQAGQCKAPTPDAGHFFGRLVLGSGGGGVLLEGLDCLEEEEEEEEYPPSPKRGGGGGGDRDAVRKYGVASFAASFGPMLSGRGDGAVGGSH